MTVSDLALVTQPRLSDAVDDPGHDDDADEHTGDRDHDGGPVGQQPVGGTWLFCKQSCFFRQLIGNYSFAVFLCQLHLFSTLC